MTRSLRLLAALMLLPALASAYGGSYGVHCSHAQEKAGKCKKPGQHHDAPQAAQGQTTAGPTVGGPGGGPAAGGGPGKSTPMGGAPPGAPPLPPGMDPAQLAQAQSALKESQPTNGKCPDGSTPVPGLNGATRCIPAGAAGQK